MSLTNKERGRLDRLKDRCHVLQARLDANTAGKQDWEQELSALSWAVAKIEAFPPEALRKPDAWRVWAKGRKFTRGLYEKPTAEDFAIWQADGDEAEPLYADPQASSRTQIPEQSGQRPDGSAPSPRGKQ